MKNFIKSIALRLLKIKLNIIDLNELLDWQRNSYLFPPPVYIKKEVLNSLNTVDSHWYEISKEKSIFTQYLSKVSECVYFLNDSQNKEKQEGHYNRENIKELTTVDEIISSISESRNLNKSVFILIHSNSSPKLRKKYYHQSSLSQIRNGDKDVFFEEIFKKISELNNLTLIIDDFDTLDASKKRFLIEHYDFNIISNMLILNI